jgi:pyruvate dehydrogenase E2 component (dihydrolipoamide acetyltransferase)
VVIYDFRIVICNGAFVMPVKVLMPALSPTMTAGNLVKWVKKEGDKIKPGDVIAEIETDKATMEVESVDEGILAKITISSGVQNVPVGSLIAIVLEDGEDAGDIDAFVAKHSTATSMQSDKKPQITENKIEAVVVSANNDSSKNSTRILASPLAKRLAQDKGINLGTIEGSGPNGRIIKSDVENSKTSVDVFQAVCRNSNEYTVESHTNIRRIIATRLVESKQNVPHFYLNIECILDKLLDVRNDINEAADLKYKISVNDMIIKAVSLALRDIPQANASWDDSGMIFYNNVDVCVAVAIEGGLITPVIRNSDQKSLLDLSSEMKILVQKAKENKLRPEEFQGGGFTISNLGMYGIRRFSAIINPPQSCIMAVGEGVKRAVVEDNQIKVKTVMDITLSCDHRVVDGAVGAKFLAVFKEYIEKPVKMLL